MTKFLAVILLTGLPVLAQAELPAGKLPLSDREQVKSDRAKAAEDEKNATTARPWDRDADGKRPWERKNTVPSPATPKS
ncbi:hypothetical protein ACVOMS_10905 [Bradyrhizobium guangxiense]|jgi:hypothetical protein|nr:MAG: hypothetical protein EKK33_18695 [Bradyrhizobiaceae bacterium]